MVVAEGYPQHIHGVLTDPVSCLVSNFVMQDVSGKKASAQNVITFRSC